MAWGTNPWDPEPGIGTSTTEPRPISYRAAKAGCVDQSRAAAGVWLWAQFHVGLLRAFQSSEYSQGPDMTLDFHPGSRAMESCAGFTALSPHFHDLGI